jgi:hypothetical protein
MMMISIPTHSLFDLPGLIALSHVNNLAEVSAHSILVKLYFRTIDISSIIRYFTDFNLSPTSRRAFRNGLELLHKIFATE